jgi:CheY-like chemotaxis protein
MTARSRLLIADDEPAIGTIVARVATQLGLTPLLVSDGAQAIHAAQTSAPELLGAILDVIMPGTTGVEAAEAIHKLLPDLPIIMMSGSLPPHLVSRLTQLPVVAVLQKPFTIAELRAVLSQLRLPGQTP